MFELIGCRTNHGGCCCCSKENKEMVLATFDDELSAYKYIKDSLFARFRSRGGTSIGVGDRPFKKRSLLSDWNHAEVREVPSDPPHNPELGE